MSHILVVMQIVAVGLCAWPVGSMVEHTWLAICALGVPLGAWVLLHNRIGNFGVYPEPSVDGQLIVSGPYRYLRHPMYTTLLLLMLGVVLYNGTPWNYVGFALLLLALLGKIHKEEAYLRDKFPDYEAYSQGTKRLVPFLY